MVHPVLDLLPVQKQIFGITCKFLDFIRPIVVPWWMSAEYSESTKLMLLLLVITFEWRG